MKWIKLFENFRNEISYLEEIFIELEHEDFLVNMIYIGPGGIRKYDKIQINIRKIDKGPASFTDEDLIKYRFTIEDVWSTLETATSYMSTKGFKLDLVKGMYLIDEEYRVIAPVIYDSDTLAFYSQLFTNPLSIDDSVFNLNHKKLLSLRIEFNK